MENTINFSYSDLIGIAFNKIVSDSKQRTVKVKEDIKTYLKNMKTKTSNFFSLTARKERLDQEIVEKQEEMKQAEKDGLLFELISDESYLRNYRFLLARARIAMLTKRFLDFLIRKPKKNKEEDEDVQSFQEIRKLEKEEMENWKQINNVGNNSNGENPLDPNKEEEPIDPNKEEEKTNKEIEEEVQQQFEDNPINIEKEEEPINPNKEEPKEESPIDIENKVRSKIDKLFDENEFLKENNEKLKKALQEEKNNNIAKESELNSLNKDLKAEKNINSNLNTDLNNKIKEIQDLKKSLEDQKQYYLDLQEQMKSKDEVIEQLKAAKKAEEEKVKKAEEEIINNKTKHEIEIEKAKLEGRKSVFEELEGRIEQKEITR